MSSTSTSTSHCNPEPKLFIFNVSKAGAPHTCEMLDSGAPPYLFLPSFASALGSAVKHGAIVQGAIYSGSGGRGQVEGEGATIFIDSEDEQWANRIGIERREEVEKRLPDSAKVVQILEQAKKNQANLAQPTQPASHASESSSAQKYPVSIFKLGPTATNAPQQHVLHDSSSEGNEESDSSQPLLRAFIDAIYSLVNQGAEVEGAMYGPEEGAKIFVRGE